MSKCSGDRSQKCKPQMSQEARRPPRHNLNPFLLLPERPLSVCALKGLRHAQTFHFHLFSPDLFVLRVT